MTTAIQPVSPAARLHGWFAAVRDGGPESGQTGRQSSRAAAKVGDNTTFAGAMANEQRWQNLLRQRDGAIRQEEQSHKAVAGQFATGISYDFEPGPNGELVVSGGAVQVDLKPIPGDPAGTIRKMQRIQQAALSVASPSPQDREVAAAAASIARAALDQLAQERQEDLAVAAPAAAPDAAEPPTEPATESTATAVDAAPSAEEQDDALLAADEPEEPRPMSERAFLVHEAYALPTVVQTGLLYSARL